LAVERDEAALTFKARAERQPLEPRVDINPVATLGVRLVTAQAVDRLPGTPPEHGWNILGGRHAGGG
jgi:hypothetical protein